MFRKSLFFLASVFGISFLVGIFLWSQATDYTWTQNNWSGGDSINVAAHSQDANSIWTEYQSKNNSLDASNDISLAKNSDVTETSDTDFNSLDQKDVTVGINNNSIVLLKPNGAVCAANEECQSGGCDTNICVFVCGNNLEFNGITYATVLANDGNCWLQQNLGAPYVATAVNDSSAYGWHYQWGRGTDGHQIPTSGTTWTSSNSNVPGHSNFIFADVGTNYDWRWPQNNSLWQGVNGINNPCPVGWRIPTSPEWGALISSENIVDITSAYNSSLKIAATGYRSRTSGSMAGTGYSVWHWSSTVGGTRALEFYISGTNVLTDRQNLRSLGYPIRCIKD